MQLSFCELKTIFYPFDHSPTQQKVNYMHFYSPRVNRYAITAVLDSIRPLSRHLNMHLILHFEF